MKIQAVFDIKDQSYRSFGLTPFTRTDQAASRDILEVLEPADLVLRDLGYFATDSMRKIEQRNAYYCSRLRFRVKVFDPVSGEPLNLLPILQKRGRLDIDVLVGLKEKLPTRLVATPVPTSIADQRRRKLNQSKDSRCKFSQEQMMLCNWEILITNIPRENYPDTEILKIYQLRWGIENIFKTWKSNFKIQIFPTRVSPTQLEAITYARLLLITLYQCSWGGDIARLDSNISMQKLSNFFCTFFWVSASSNGNAQSANAVICAVINYFCSHEKRKKRKNYSRKAEDIHVNEAGKAS